MTLEDFFTLTEMKDGLTAVARVEELVSVMQKEKTSVVKNVGEAARQWSTVASTLVATENKDCLDLFIRLDGLRFLNHWLQEAQKYCNDMSDNFVEESIAALLGALEKLPIDNERSISSGIGATVKDLFGQKSCSIRDRARALSDSWSQGKDNDANHQDAEKGETCCDGEVTASDIIDPVNGCSGHSAVNVSPFKGSSGVDNPSSEFSGGEFQQSRSSDVSQSKIVQDMKIPISNNQATAHTALCQAEDDGFSGDALGSSIMSEPCQESPLIMEKSSIHPSEGAASTCARSPSVSLKDNVQGKASGIPELKVCTADVKELAMVKGSTDKVGKKESYSATTSLGTECASTSNPDIQQSAMKPAVRRDADAKESEFYLEKNSPFGHDTDMGAPASDLKIEVVDSGLPKHSRSTMELKATGKGGECYPNVFPDLSREEDTGLVNDAKEITGKSIWKVGEGEDLVITGNVSRPSRDSKGSVKVYKKSEMDLEYGVDDALEVARQVAKEVEREVVDYREAFCSTSSEKNSEVGIVQPDSPDSINGKPDLTMLGPQNEVPTGQNILGAASSPKGEEHLISSKNTDTKPEDCIQGTESSQVIEAAQEPADNTGKGMQGFDLNQEVVSEGMDHPSMPIAAPILVASSKAAASAPGLSVSPLPFEGTSGWKGSAATSAFRPASPWRTPDGDGSSYSSKQRQEFLDIDLNVAGGDDGVTDPVLPKHFPVSLGLPSGESSAEVSSRRGERLKLDLNRIGDNEDAPSSDWRMDGRSFIHRNGHRSPSPSSSSSSRQSSMKNIDLNDSPSFFDNSNDQRPSLGKSSSQEMNRFISIMGMRVEVNRKETDPQNQSFLPNGLIAESVMDVNLARTGSMGARPPVIAYTLPPPFGCNSLGMGLSMTLSPPMYRPGSVPCMVDSRGAPVVPQIMGSPATFPPSYSRPPPFVISMTGPSTGFNGIGTTRPNLDLNSGLMMADSENRDAGGLSPGQSGLIEEQMRTVSQPSSSGMGGKRKEPDGGWDPHYKQQPPPQ